MVRTPLRVLLATWTLVALIVTSVGPVVSAAWAEASGQGDDHACCPEKVGEGAPASRSSDAPVPCCAIGNPGSRSPAGTPTPVRSSTPHDTPVLAPSWNQSVSPRVDVQLQAVVAFGPIPLVIRTSVLLI